VTAPPNRTQDNGPAATSGQPVVDGRVERLVHELQEQAGLNEVDAYRAAFTALALAEGWSKARIGRYLGISRARVGQKVEKLQDYAHTLKVPTLKRLMSKADIAHRVRDERLAIQFKTADWSDLEFARGMCAMLA
jgi:hypothetical protein